MSQFRKCGRKRPPISGRLRQVDQPISPDSTAQLTEALEEAGDDLLLREVAGEAVGGQDRAVVRLMRLAKRRRHARLVVQIRQTAIGILPANVQNPLRRRVNHSPPAFRNRVRFCFAKQAKACKNEIAGINAFEYGI